jgi:hypothetical protein
MNAVVEKAHVTLSGDIAGEYLVEDRRPDGRLVLVPDTGIDAIRKRVGTRAMTAHESEEFWRENGPLMLPPDDEG